MILRIIYRDGNRDTDKYKWREIKTAIVWYSLTCTFEFYNQILNNEILKKIWKWNFAKQNRNRYLDKKEMIYGSNKTLMWNSFSSFTINRESLNVSPKKCFFSTERTSFFERQNAREESNSKWLEVLTCCVTFRVSASTKAEPSTDSS